MVWPFFLAGWLWSTWKSYGTRVSTESGKSARLSSSRTPSAAERSSYSCLPRTEELLVAFADGDLVTVKLMPHLGCGVVKWALAGRVKVSFEADGPYVDEFGEGELERATPRIARTA